MSQREELDYEDVLRELHAMMGERVTVAVYGPGGAHGHQLADLIGRLTEGMPFEPDRFMFRIRGEPDADPHDARAIFFLSPADYRGGRWRLTPHQERELLIELEFGAFGLALESEDE